MKWIGWDEFLNQMDIAMALWIEDGGTKDKRYPSKTSLLEFAKYAKTK